MTAVALDLYDEQDVAGAQAWHKFAQHMIVQASTPRSHRHNMQQHLALYGAWTNWHDPQDPIWFPDSDSLMQFKLTWM